MPKYVVKMPKYTSNFKYKTRSVSFGAQFFGKLLILGGGGGLASETSKERLRDMLQTSLFQISNRSGFRNNPFLHKGQNKNYF